MRHPTGTALLAPPRGRRHPAWRAAHLSHVRNPRGTQPGVGGYRVRARHRFRRRPRRIRIADAVQLCVGALGDAGRCGDLGGWGRRDDQRATRAAACVGVSVAAARDVPPMTETTYERARPWLDRGPEVVFDETVPADDRATAVSLLGSWDPLPFVEDVYRVRCLVGGAN